MGCVPGIITSVFVIVSLRVIVSFVERYRQYVNLKICKATLGSHRQFLRVIVGKLSPQHPVGPLSSVFGSRWFHKSSMLSV